MGETGFESDVLGSRVVEQLFFFTYIPCCCCSFAKSCWTLCDPIDYSMPGFWPHRLQHARLPCPSSSSRVCSSSCPLSWWCHPTISFSFASFSSCLQSLLAWGSFLVSQLFKSFRIYWFDLLAVQGTLKHLLQHHSWKASILWHSTFFMLQLSHPSLTTGLYPLPNLFLSKIHFSDRSLKLRNILEPLWHEIARNEEGWVSKPIISDFRQNLIVSPIENNWNFLTRWLVVPVTKIKHTYSLKGFMNMSSPEL